MINFYSFLSQPFELMADGRCVSPELTCHVIKNPTLNSNDSPVNLSKQASSYSIHISIIFEMNFACFSQSLKLRFFLYSLIAQCKWLWLRLVMDRFFSLECPHVSPKLEVNLGIQSYNKLRESWNIQLPTNYGLELAFRNDTTESSTHESSFASFSKYHTLWESYCWNE